MNDPINAQVLVVGGGPGGYVAAIRAGQLGLNTVLVTNEGLGGTCLLRGCIPSKALIHAANQFYAISHPAEIEQFGISLPQPPDLDWPQLLRWKQSIVHKLSAGVSGLLRRANVRVIQGWATFEDAKNCTVESEHLRQRISASSVILATGSVPQLIPALPLGRDILSSTDLLDLETLPKSVVVVGAGYIGLELGTVLAKLGTRVTIIEQQDHILPQYDGQLTAPVRSWLEHGGITIHLGASVKEARKSVDGMTVLASKNGEPLSVSAEKILVTIGRRPNTSGWGIEKMGLDMNGLFVRIDDECRTSMQNVWAIGDLTGEPMLAHKASAQGVTVAEIIAGNKRRFVPAAIPAVCFTEPEIISVGLSPQQCEEIGVEITVASFPLAASGRAMTMSAEQSGGYVRVVARKDNQQIIGFQAVGSHISELSGEFSLALEMSCRLDDLGATIHAHPTLSEMIPEAALRNLGHAIHG